MLGVANQSGNGRAFACGVGKYPTTVETRPASGVRRRDASAVLRCLLGSPARGWGGCMLHVSLTCRSRSADAKVRSGRASARFTRDVLTRRGPRRSCSHRRTARPLSTGCSSPTLARPSERPELASPISAARAIQARAGHGSSARTGVAALHQPSMRPRSESTSRRCR